MALNIICTKNEELYYFGCWFYSGLSLLFTIYLVKQEFYRCVDQRSAFIDIFFVYLIINNFLNLRSIMNILFNILHSLKVFKSFSFRSKFNFANHLWDKLWDLFWIGFFMMIINFLFSLYFLGFINFFLIQILNN